MVSDPMGTRETVITTPTAGMVIGRSNFPLVYEGDATFHIARFDEKGAVVERRVELFQEEHDSEIAPVSGDDAPNAPIA